jgi:hypothetical protein
MSIRWPIAMITFFLICTLISNVMENQVAFNNSQMSQIQLMQQGQVTEAKAQAQANSGTGLSTSGIIPLDAIQAILKSLTMEYSFLYTVSTGYTETTCNTAGGRWQSATNTCKIPNDWYLPFMVLLWGPLVVVGLYFLVYLFRG